MLQVAAETVVSHIIMRRKMSSRVDEDGKGDTATSNDAVQEITPAGDAELSINAGAAAAANAPAAAVRAIAPAPTVQAIMPVAATELKTVGKHTIIRARGYPMFLRHAAAPLAGSPLPAMSPP